MRIARWIARLIEGRRRARQRREFERCRDVCGYLDDQIAAVNMEIVRADAEMTGLVATRDKLQRTLAHFEYTSSQTEALYRQA